MGKFIEVEVKTSYPDERRLEMSRYTDDGDAQFRVQNLYEGGAEWTYVGKEELLDGLARLGWLPDEYRKPKPVSPREAKIREVALLLQNDDAAREVNRRYMTEYATYEEFANAEDSEVDSYRQNAAALIDAGLVKVEESA